MGEIVDGQMRQVAPYPDELAKLVEQLHYPPWTFRLDDFDRGQGSAGLTLVISAHVEDSYHPGRMITVQHYMVVLPAAYDRRAWRRWLFDQIMLVHRHEAMENFRLVHKGDFINTAGERVDEYVERPYAPSHGPGNDPYMIREVGTREDQRTSARGRLNPS